MTAFNPEAEIGSEMVGGAGMSGARVPGLAGVPPVQMMVGRVEQGYEGRMVNGSQSNSKGSSGEMKTGGAGAEDGQSGNGAIGEGNSSKAGPNAAFYESA